MLPAPMFNPHVLHILHVLLPLTYFETCDSVNNHRTDKLKETRDMLCFVLSLESACCAMGFVLCSSHYFLVGISALYHVTRFSVVISHQRSVITKSDGRSSRLTFVVHEFSVWCISWIGKDATCDARNEQAYKRMNGYRVRAFLLTSPSLHIKLSPFVSKSSLLT